MATSDRLPARDVLLLAGLLGGSGVLHLVRPGLFRSMVPKPLPYKHQVVLGSGVAEIATAGLLVVPATRRAGGVAAGALLAGVWPANVQMSVDAFTAAKPWWYRIGTLLRLPLQVPLLQAAARVARADR